MVFFLKRIYENLGDSIKYYGVDISEKVIDLAKKKFNKAKYFIAPGEKLPFEDQTFDYIQNISTLEHVISPSEVLKEMYRVLKKNGYIYIVIHKKSIDPLFIYTLLDFFNSIKKRIFNKKQKRISEFELSLKYVRNDVKSSIKELNLKLLSRGDLVSYINLNFYRKLKIPMKFLMKIANLTNKLSLSCFKNLEYQIYKK
ncbi:MAG: class I SAM-dependent methyltransferase [Promethearchaeota archaeon]